jgi:hypothetical protein
MSSKYLIKTAVSILVLVTLCLIVLVRLPIASLVPWGEYQITATDIDRSTVFRGEMYLDLARAPTLGRVLASWHWCPGLQPLTWCMEMQAIDLEIDGHVSLGFSSVSIWAANAQLTSLLPIGIASSLASMQASVRVEELVVADLSCPAGSLEKLTASAEVVDITLFGSSLGGANLAATGSQGAAEARLFGDHMAGNFESSSDLNYSGVFAITPTPELEPLFNQLARPGATGEYEWRASGRLPCGWS